MDVAFGTYHRDGYWSMITGSFVTRGLDYAQNRFYDPARGRFTSADPAASGTIARPNSWNRYSYTEGDPVNFNDPEGLFIANPWYQTGQNWMSFSLFWGSMLPGPVHQPMLGLDGPGSGGGGLPPCDELLRSVMSSFLKDKGSPLLITQDKTLVSDVMAEAKLVGVDPRLFIAETAESGWGTWNVAQTMNNPFGLKDSGGNSRFPGGVGDAILAEGSTLNKYVNKYNFTVSQMYSGLPGLLDRRGWNWVRPPAYCQGAGCVALGNVISDALKAMGGDPDGLKYPSGQVGSTKCKN